MADGVYTSGLEGFADGSYNWVASTIKIMGVGIGYTYAAADKFRSAVAVGDRIFTSPALTGKTATGGVLDATDATVPTVSGSQVKALVFYVDTGNVATDRLVSYVDSYSGLPYTPIGRDLQIVFPNDANKILKL